MRRMPSAIITGSHVTSFTIIRYDRYFGDRASLCYHQSPRLKHQEVQGRNTPYAKIRNYNIRPINPFTHPSMHTSTHTPISAPKHIMRRENKLSNQITRGKRENLNQYSTPSPNAIVPRNSHLEGKRYVNSEMIGNSNSEVDLSINVI